MLFKKTRMLNQELLFSFSVFLKKCLIVVTEMKWPEYTLDLTSSGPAQTAMCVSRTTQNEICPPLPFDFESVTPEIKQKRYQLSFTDYIVLLLGVETCTERPEYWIRGKVIIKQNLEEFVLFGGSTGFFSFFFSHFLFFFFTYNNICSDFS